MNRLTLTMLVIFSGAAVFGQELRVQYLEGLVEVQRGSAWYQVSAGDAIAGGSLVRLDDGAFAELSGGGATLRLARRGTYDLGKLTAATKQTQAAGVGSFLTQRARSMTAPEDSSPKRGVGVAGVRGAAADQGAITWVGGDSAGDLLAAGLRKLNGGDYKAAYDLFQDAAESASGPDHGRAAFYVGYAAYLSGDVPAALRTLESPRPDPATRYYDDHVLVLAQVLVETFAYTDAADLLQGYLGSGRPGPESAQTALLLLGLSHKGLGNRELAAESLRAAQRPNPGSPAALAAAKLLETP